MRSLKFYTSLWAMMPHDQSGTILPYDQICEMVAGAGYDGMAIDLGAGDVAQAREVRPHMERAGLTPLIVAFPKTIESLRDTLIMAKDFGAPFVDVIGQVMPLSVDGMIPVIRRWIDMADEVGMPIQFETHRNCITNDLYATLCLMDAIPEMRLCADLSHVGSGIQAATRLSGSGPHSADHRPLRQFSGTCREPPADTVAAGLPPASKMGGIVQRLVA